MEYTDERVRARANELIGLIAAHGYGPEARRLAELMVEFGYFPAALQRPIRYVDGLRACEFHRPDSFEVIRYLESHAATIRSEVMEFLETDHSVLSDVEEPLVDRGGVWQEVVFFEAGVRSERVARTLPMTSSILDGLDAEVRAAGVIMLSRIGPDTHIVPHCGETNARLRLHLGIKVPADAMMRVGAEVVRWEVDKCIVFDDSFEHEVWNFGDDDRIVLIVDLPHPDSPVHEPPSEAAVPLLQQRVADLMGAAHVSGIYRDSASREPRLIPDSFLSLKLNRYLGELGTDQVNLEGDGRLNVYAPVDDCGVGPRT